MNIVELISNNLRKYGNAAKISVTDYNSPQFHVTVTLSKSCNKLLNSIFGKE